MGLQQDVQAAAERSVQAFEVPGEWTRADIQRDAILMLLSAMALEINALRQEVELLKVPD